VTLAAPPPPQPDAWLRVGGRFPMKPLGRNQGGYCGETINIPVVLQEIEAAALDRGWTSETFHTDGEFKWLALRRPPASSAASPPTLRVYISAGVHGDEPAGPLAVLRLLQADRWPDNAAILVCPCLNPVGFAQNKRENADGLDLNRDYRHRRSAEVRAHVAWLQKQSPFDLCLCLHEDWEAQGFYVYELNPDHQPSLAETIVAAVRPVCPLDLSEIIEGREAKGGIIRPALDPRTRPQWPEAFWLILHRTRLSYTLEAPSDFPLATRVNALVAGVNAALARLGMLEPRGRSPAR
jgi:protein MpaA